MIASTYIYQDISTLGKCITTFIFSIILFILTGIHYIISGNKLIIKIWFIALMTIDIRHITSIKRSYNPLSSPAASLKRLAIYRLGNYEYLYTLISPIREQEFISELRRINPHIRIYISDKTNKMNILDWDI